jgi:hypothetical protein
MHQRGAAFRLKAPDGSRSGKAAAEPVRGRPETPFCKSKPAIPVAIRAIPIAAVRLFTPKLGMRRKPVRRAAATLATVDIAYKFPAERPTSARDPARSFKAYGLTIPRIARGGKNRASEDANIAAERSRE